MRMLILCAALFTLPVGRSAELAKPAKPPADPWVGEYYTHDRHSGKDSKHGRLAIVKHADGTYRLDNHYREFKFTETEKGVLSDGKGGLGKLILGEAKFADGSTIRIIKAEFCYEQFTLMDPWQDLENKR